MEILIDGRLYGLENAGLGRYLINLVKQLQSVDKENSYTILLRKKYFNSLKFPRNWKKVEADFRHYSIKEQLLLPYLLHRVNPDVVHFPHFNVPILYFGKYVVTIHDLLMHKFRGNEVTTLPKPFYLLRRLGYKIAFWRAVRGSVKIVVPSETVKYELVRRYKLRKSKVTVTFEGVDKNFLIQVDSKRVSNVLTEYGLKSGEYFVYSGNAYQHKNLEFAIKSFMVFVKDKNSNIYFAICSSRNVFTKRLVKYVKKIGGENIIKILGFVPDEEYNILLQGSIGFIYPSLSEGFGLQGLEAIASGTLLLASDIPVFREVYGRYALYFDPTNSKSLIKALINSLKINSNLEDKRKIVTESKDFIKRYSWQKMAKETLTIYESCVSIRSGE